MPHGAPEAVAYGILIFFSIVLIVHWARRTRRPPVVTESPQSGTVEDRTLFDRFQRFFHWTTTAVLVIVIITGFALYDPFTFEPVTDALGLPLHSAFPSYVFVHVIFSTALAVLLVLHVIWDVKRLRAIRQMWPRVQDFHDALLRARNFLSLGKEYPRMPKYDFFMKGFHIYLVVAVVVLAFTGIYQYYYAAWWTVVWYLHYQVEPAWRPTIIHDLFGFGLVALVVGHIYFASLRVNRPLLTAMIHGKVSKAEVNRRYRPEELPPE